MAGCYARHEVPLCRSVESFLPARSSRQETDEAVDNERITLIHRAISGDGQRRYGNVLARSDGYVACVAGRLDNEKEIQRSLSASVIEAGNNAATLIALYRTLGVGGFRRMLGAFTLAICDPSENRLILASDSMGTRPLYYHVSREFVCWSSRCRPLLQSLALPTVLDEEYVADFLLNRPSARSPFRGIGVVPGGHALVVGRDTVELSKYWAPEAAAELTYGSDHEYEEHFREIFRSAVACRMPRSAPAFCELSGGLDSSSITCVANGLIRARAVAALGLHTVSYVFDRATTSDERSFIRVVEAAVESQRTHVSEVGHPLLRPLPSGFVPDIPTTQLCFQERQNQVTRLVGSSGTHVLLNGMGGDDVFFSEPPEALELTDAMSREGLWHSLRLGRRLARQFKWPLWRMLWSGMIQPYLPPRWNGSARWDQGELWGAGFARRTGFDERNLVLDDDLGFRLPSASLQYRMLRHTMRLYVLEWCSSEGHLDVRYPYLDRRLVEFALAIPLDQKVRGREDRSIVRRSLRGVVPDPILSRSTKAGPAEAFYRAIARQWSWLSQIMAEPVVVEFGIADAEALSSALVKARHGFATGPVQLLRMLSLELWLRTLEYGEPPVPRPRRAPRRESREAAPIERARAT